MNASWPAPLRPKSSERKDSTHTQLHGPVQAHDLGRELMGKNHIAQLRKFLPKCSPACLKHSGSGSQVR